mmetsp:Transcript_16727/g.38318  ORF Transcript_16727/g.38318 Transcript_16727/m.38318 type:complete len:255 (+) Transcript_16727:469-1233(+)
MSPGHRQEGAVRRLPDGGGRGRSHRRHREAPGAQPRRAGERQATHPPVAVAPRLRGAEIRRDARPLRAARRRGSRHAHDPRQDEAEQDGQDRRVRLGVHKAGRRARRAPRAGGGERVDRQPGRGPGVPEGHRRRRRHVLGGRTGVSSTLHRDERRVDGAQADGAGAAGDRAGLPRPREGVPALRGGSGEQVQMHPGPLASIPPRGPAASCRDTRRSHRYERLGRCIPCFGFDTKNTRRGRAQDRGRGAELVCEA